MQNLVGNGDVHIYTFGSQRCVFFRGTVLHCAIYQTLFSHIFLVHIARIPAAHLDYCAKIHPRSTEVICNRWDKYEDKTEKPRTPG